MPTVLDNLVYYSTNSYLAFHLSKTYYNDSYYVWCSPVFDPDSLDKRDPRRRIHASSSPSNIYKVFKREVDSGVPGDKINENKNNLKIGALKRHNAGEITIEELNLIHELIENAEIYNFSPMLYIIPKYKVESKIERVPIRETATILSEEYRISKLEIEDFDIIEF